MNPLLEQFLSESRECTQGIAEKLMQLENAPNDQDIIKELFRLVHTLKGNSGLFTYPEMTRVLHAGEDLLGMVRDGKVAYSRKLADCLLDAMDFFTVLCADVETTEKIDAARVGDSVEVAASLRALIPAEPKAADSTVSNGATAAPAMQVPTPLPSDLPDSIQLEALHHFHSGEVPQWIVYTPARECFFQGDDPFYSARQTPSLLWGTVQPTEALPKLDELDTFSCLLEFHLLSTASPEELAEHFRYVPDQVKINPLWLADPQAAPVNDHDADMISGGLPQTLKTHPASREDSAALDAILSAQQQILSLNDHPAWEAGRIRAVAAVLENLSRNTAVAVGDAMFVDQLQAALSESLALQQSTPLLKWLEEHKQKIAAVDEQSTPITVPGGALAMLAQTGLDTEASPDNAAGGERIKYGRRADDSVKFGRRAEDSVNGPRSLKVDQAKVDRLMNLIGELVVSKNALPYLAQRAEAQYGVRELSREIKGQYAVINRIADEMQDAIMQVRMMAVSFVFQRFPRLVRDISRKLGKEVQLVLEGEQTEADKNIIESLADPLIHIVRNSLDHGLETPEVRRACGKPETGTLTIRASQQADRVVIEIADDGKGIDPAIIKRKAYEKGLIDEAALERIDNREAVNLIFAAGLSTAATISDLSGRGVGMDVVRSAVEKINGTVVVESEVGKGTTIRISLPLSMAVTQVMIVESDGQLFGVPMDHVVETVRVPRKAIRSIKQSKTAVLRGRIVLLKPLNDLLGITAPPRVNEDDELAVLLVQAGSGVLGLVLDGFKETVGIIQKPLGGFLSGLSAYSGSALMGDGSVLMILNIREIV
jgi:two-component system chemotaxis sensor kinase CheA